jgi:ABC-type phosphate transport system auxiliary subunit
MLKIFFFLLFSCGINAQQLESLKILKTKHDSIETQLKLKYQEEINKQINEIQHSGQDIINEYEKIQARMNKILTELSKNR